ncbi:MAG: serine hydrolase domain-containing protein [Gemmatimonadales bacterium]
MRSRLRVGIAVAVLALGFGPPVLAAQAFDGADAAVTAGIRQGVYPGAVLVVGSHDRILHAAAFGRFTWGRHSARVSVDSTEWDLASLTKVVATTPAVMLLVDQGRIDLDAPVRRYLARFAGAEKDRVTVRMLLDHTSGEPAWVPFFRLAPSRDSAIALLFATPLARKPGLAPVYSDLNALLLGLLVEQVTGEPLDRFVGRELFDPLIMTATRFRPPSSWRPRTAPTGRYRGHPVAGAVNDQNSARFGGVAGHAGLFSTGSDLARYAQFWLRRGTLADGRGLVRQATIDTFLSPSPASGHRLLGWERPDPAEYHPDPYGALLSASAYGHTGWTGTQLWIDPAQDLFVVLLTNRSYDPRVRKPFTALHAVRGLVADAVVRAVCGDNPSAGRC